MPFLHSNTSSLETHFSEMRAKGADTAQKHTTAIATAEHRKASDSLHSHHNCWYEGTVDKDKVQVNSSGFDGKICSSKAMRKKIFDT